MLVAIGMPLDKGSQGSPSPGCVHRTGHRVSRANLHAFLKASPPYVIPRPLSIAVVSVIVDLASASRPAKLAMLGHKVM